MPLPHRRSGHPAGRLLHRHDGVVIDFGRVIIRNRGQPGPFDSGWKDTVLAGHRNTIQVAARRR